MADEAASLHKTKQVNRIIKDGKWRRDFGGGELYLLTKLLVALNWGEPDVSSIAKAGERLSASWHSDETP
jgi:hypothetical protein